MLQKLNVKRRIFFVLLFVALLLNISLIIYPHNSSLPNIALSQSNEYRNTNIGLKMPIESPWYLSPNSTPDKNCDSCIIVLENKNNPSLTMSILAENINQYINKCDCKSLKDFVQIQFANKYKPSSITSIVNN